MSFIIVLNLYVYTLFEKLESLTIFNIILLIISIDFLYNNNLYIWQLFQYELKISEVYYIVTILADWIEKKFYNIWQNHLSKHYY